MEITPKSGGGSKRPARTRDLNASRAQLRHSKQAMALNYTHPEDELGLAAVDAAYTAQVVPLHRVGEVS